GRLAEAVFQLVGKAFDVLRLLEALEARIKIDADHGLGNIVRRDKGGEAQIELGGFKRLECFALGGGKGALQHLLVETGADQVDMAGLVFAQKVAGPAQFKITRGNLEARAKPVESLQGCEDRKSTRLNSSH